MKRTTISRISDYIENGYNIDTDLVDFTSDKHGYIVTTNTIKEVTPITLSSNKVDDKEIGTVFFLCKNVDDTLFILYHSYVMENEEDIDIFKLNPIHDSQNFLSKMVASNIIIHSMANYNTDLNFFKEGDSYYLYGVDSKDLDNTIHKIEMNTDIFTSIAYIDNAIYESLLDDHDMISATAVGARPSNANTFIVDNIDSVTSMALADKDTNTIAVIFKPLRYVDHGAEIIKVLMPVCVEEKFNKKKFNTTVDKITETFDAVGENYILDFMFDIALEDKEYLALRVNNNSSSLLLLLGEDQQTKLAELIDKF